MEAIKLGKNVQIAIPMLGVNDPGRSPSTILAGVV